VGAGDERRQQTPQASPGRRSGGAEVSPQGGPGPREIGRRTAGLPSEGVARRSAASRRLRHARLPGRGPTAFGRLDPRDRRAPGGAIRRSHALGRGAARRRSAGAARQRLLCAEGPDAARARPAFRRWAAERQGARADERRGGRGGPHRGARDRAVERPWLPARGSEPARRLSVGGPRAQARDPAGIRLRPPSDRGRGD
jgi:hypothetical protein